MAQHSLRMEGFTSYGKGKYGRGAIFNIYNTV